MKRYSSAPCLENIGGDVKRAKGTEQHTDPDTREYLQLALARVLELQREIKEGTYITQIDNGSSDLDMSDNEEDLAQEIFAKVFQDLPGTPSSIVKVINGETRWNNHRINAICGKRMQLLGFDTCRKTAIDFMKTIVRESRDRSDSSQRDSFNNIDLAFRQNESLFDRNRILARELGKQESNASHAQEIRTRMLRSLDLHLANKQRDYTAKLMRSGI